MKQRKLTRSIRFSEEMLCEKQGYHLIAGIDEVGRGCLAGPVVAAAVMISHKKRPAWFKQVRDSKLLTPRQREFLSPRIHQFAISVGIGTIDSISIDSLGMTRAVHLAMRMALSQLSPQPGYVLIDYLTIPELALPQKGVANGDTNCFSIACASIVAKVFRDRLMIELDHKYPGYGLARHKGYSTAEHLTCLRKLGPSPVHRRLFRPVRNLAQFSFDHILQNNAGTKRFET